MKTTTPQWLQTILALSIGVLFYSCTNPFAPRLDDGSQGDFLFGDQRTVEGIFQNFRYAYAYKDSATYGRLLSSDFTFTFRDYDKSEDVTWGRDEEMLTTTRLFQTAQSLDVVFNSTITVVGDTLVKDISRGFTLTIIFSPSDIVTLQGRVNMRIRRQSPDDPWLIQSWRDESNF